MTQRLPVLKTYKLFIGGAFPRSESGRSYVFKDKKGAPVANICRASRKDFRNAVVSARTAQTGWSARSGYNRGQILYRIAELIEGRKEQFSAQLRLEGASPFAARREVDKAIDRLIYFAGWSDKYQQFFSTVNPVASSHFVFSVPEATGVVAIIAPPESGLLGLISVICPVIVGGNTAVVLAGTYQPLSAVTCSEVLAAADVPPGVVNILTGYSDELLEQMAGHMDVNAIVLAGGSPEDRTRLQQKASLNVKRVVYPDERSWEGRECESPYLIMKTLEIKTTWHPVGM